MRTLHSVQLGFMACLVVACARPMEPQPNLLNSQIIGLYTLTAINDSTVPIYSEVHDSSYADRYGGSLQISDLDSLWYQVELFSIALVGHQATFRTTISTGRWNATPDGATLAGFRPNSRITFTAAATTIRIATATQRYTFERTPR